MSIQDAAVHYGAESTYGTAASLTRSFEAQVDDWRRQQEYLESQGFRAGQHGLRSDRVKAINMGGEGSLTLDVLTKGMGLILRDAFGTTTGPTQQAATTAYLQTHSTDKDGPDTSATVQLIRPFADGSTQQFTHKGCVVTGWELTQEINRYLLAKVDYNFQDVDTSTGAGTATYPSGSVPFDWSMATITLNAGAVDFSRFNLKAEYGMETDRRFLRASTLKKQPRLAAVPNITGELQGEFESLAHYNRFVSGEIVSLVALWEGATIEAAHKFTFQVEAQIQYRGESPEMALNEMPKQGVPFKVLWDGTNPMVKVTYKSTDTSL